MFQKLSIGQRSNQICKWKKDIVKSLGKDYLEKYPHFDPDNLDDLYEIEKFFRCRIHLWGKRAKNGKYERIRPSPYLAPADYDFHVDIILRDIEFADIEITLVNCGVCLHVDKILPPEIRIKRKTWTLFEALAIQKNPKLQDEISALREKTRLFETEWAKEKFHIADAKDFYKQFHANVQIWNKSASRNRKVFREKIFDRIGMPKLIGRFYIIKMLNFYYLCSKYLKTY